MGILLFILSMVELVLSAIILTLYAFLAKFYTPLIFLNLVDPILLVIFSKKAKKEELELSTAALVISGIVLVFRVIWTLAMSIMLFGQMIS